MESQSRIGLGTNYSADGTFFDVNAGVYLEVPCLAPVALVEFHA